MPNESDRIKQKSKEYPAISFDEAVSFVMKFRDFPLRQVIKKEVAAKEFKVKPTTKSFTYSVSAAKQFGLISVKGQTFTLTENAYRIIRPTETEDAICKLKLDCIKGPTLYGELIKQYEGRRLPELETLKNVLITYYSILPVVVDTAAKKFIESVNQVGAVEDGILVFEKENHADVSQSATTDKKTDNLTAQDALTPAESAGNLLSCDEFAAPLIIPFGDKRRAVLYMPIEAEKDEAKYVIEMIKLMFDRVYKVSQ